MKIERRFIKGAEVRALDGSAGSPSIAGYAAVFNEFYTLYEDDGAAFGDNGLIVRETITPGAFDPVMDNDVRCLFNHDADNVLGRSTNGTLAMGQDAKGLEFVNAMDETRIGKDVHAFIKRGDVTGCSFAFTVEDDPNAWVEDVSPTGQLRFTRTIRKMKRLYDVGPVTYPAYEQTSVDARKLITELRSANSASDIPEAILLRIENRKPAPAGMSAEVKAAWQKQTELRTTL